MLFHTSASYLHDDPAKDQLLAMGLAIDAMLQICEINDATQKNVAASLEAKVKEIAGKATQQLVEQAGPDVADAIEAATRFHLKTVRIRSIIGGAAGMLVGAALIAGFSYSAGFEAGQIHGEVAANSLALLQRVQLVQPADEKQVGKLLDHLQRVGNAPGPKAVPNLVDLVANLTCKHSLTSCELNMISELNDNDKQEIR